MKIGDDESFDSAKSLYYVFAKLIFNLKMQYHDYRI